MSDEESIIIKRLKKCPHEAHGGAWKIAFADFMTATMAFFLLLWVLGGTNDEEMKMIAEYFRDPTVIEAAPSTLVESSEAGQTSDAMIDMGGFQDAPKGKEGHDDGSGQADQEQMELLKSQLEKKIEESQVLNQLKDQLKIEITPNGLQVQILDDRKRPMFSPGVDLPKDYAATLLKAVGSVLAETPRKISIAGHTDASGYHASSDYTNWELSADRANAARRLMIDGGVKGTQIAQVVGMADTVPFDKENPYNPRNRRISIIVLNKKAEEALRNISDAPQVEALQTIRSQQ
ncbi:MULTISPECIES: flagellar motor protein MotB [Thiomicrorhabdus]|uniref:Flagellar motor protein MotB n=1 Tax=Thiomicrorhabdus heinhorstiae TaxID=2748010 RepID=A0ABS0BZ84_9GAMM|nr:MULTISPECIES: flagellar motor protein MotB [Thiomicrorhabdus]MBF6058373.1 flagellar motor protein MotB [Thiomicrorhabdus heinhorstiae]